MACLPEQGVMRPSPRLWRMRCAEVIAAGGALTVVAGTAAGLTLGGAAAVIAAAVAIAGSLAAIWFARNRVRSWVYQERDEDLIVERGVLIQRLSVVPYGRMQFVDVTAGPIDRVFRVATVKLHTAAAARHARTPGLGGGGRGRGRGGAGGGEGGGAVKDSERGTPQPPGRTPAREARSVPGPADEMRHTAGTGAEHRIRRPGRRYGVPGAEDQPPETSEAPQGRTPAREATKNAGWRRLHPLSPLGRSRRAGLAVPALAGRSTSGLFGSGPGTRWWDMALVAVVAGGAVINWLVTRWKVDGVTLRIETGLLRRDSRQLPIARIQAVDLVRPFLARMLGLAELRVRLAGSGDADGRLAYLTEPAAETLWARLLAPHQARDPATPEPAERVITSVPTGRLAGAALLPAALLAAVAVAAGAVTASLVPGGLLAVGAPLAWWLIICGMLAWRRVSTQYGFTVAVSPHGVRIPRRLLG